MNKALYFVLGAACGAAGAYFYLKKKFEQYAQEEIDSVKEMYKAEKKEENPVEEEMVEVNDPKPDLKDLKKDQKNYNRKSIKEYTDYTKFSGSTDKPEDPIHQPFTEEPEIISEEEFGEIDEYDTITLMYYSDGVLAEDISDEIVDNADEKVGTDYVDVLMKDDKDVVYVRNEIDKVDYEICKNLQTYKEVTGNDPGLVETEE